MINKLHYRILEISYKHKLGHIGSCISAVDIIDEIYRLKKQNEPFILSAGHAGIALYVVLEKYLCIDAEELYKKHGGHPHKDIENGIMCSSGSLGQAITVSLGRAIATPNRKVFCLVSDAEASEGSFYETIKFAESERIDNLIVYVNINGFGAYSKIKKHDLCEMVSRVNPDVRCRFTNFHDIPFLNGMNAHYHIMKDEDWEWTQKNHEN
jgi:transketolase N-terminal domain/subunit